MGLIYLDTCVIIYLAEDQGDFGRRTRELTSEVGAEHQFAISSSTKMECLVRPVRLFDAELVDRYSRLLAEMVFLELTDAVYLRAAELRAHFRLRTPDAIHLAAAQLHVCEELWTNDQRLAVAGRGLVRSIFD